MSNGRKKKGPPFVMFYHRLVDCPNYAHLSTKAVKLLLEVARQYNGKNNGDLSITLKLMKKYGWNSNDQLGKATKELVHYGFIELSRQGGRNQCNLFALTWQPIDECDGKHELSATAVAKNSWKEDQSELPSFKKSLYRPAVQAIPPYGAVAPVRESH